MFDRDALLTRTDLPALADELLGTRRGTGRSGTWRCPSAQHAQTGRTPPVNIFIGRDGYQRWHCHGCGIGGTAIDLVMTAHGLRVRDALEYLAQRTGTRDHPGLATRPPRPPATRGKRPSPQPTVRDPDGLRRYIHDCATRLEHPAGTQMRAWLTETRGIPETVLHRNRVGADPGARHQPRPDGIPRTRSPAAVFPAIHDGRVVFAQLRLLQPPPDGPRYLNAASRLADNPKIALYQPTEPTGRSIVVTEGPTDALSAAAGGYTAAAVLGTGAANHTTAQRLASLGAPLVVAFDPDPAGDEAAHQLLAHLRERGTRATRLHVPKTYDDLNHWMRTEKVWPVALEERVKIATRCAPARPRVGRTVRR